MQVILRRPRWIGLTVAVAIVVLTFIALGLWQLDRLDERRLTNAVVASRIDRAPVPLDEVLAAGLPIGDLEFTVVSFDGTADPQRSVFVRSQTNDGVAGAHQVVPVLREDGTAVLVNVGWVPLGEHPDDVPGLDGPVEFVGLVRPSSARPSFGQSEPDGQLLEVRRIDIDRLAEQFPYPLVGAWIQLRSPDIDGAIPHLAPAPELDEGTHLAYAIQWFSFAAIAVIGFVLLIRREVGRGAGGGGGSYVVGDDPS